MSDNNRQYKTHIIMRRPYLLDLPKVAPLPEGYRLRTFQRDDALAPLATTLSAAFGVPWDIDRVHNKLTEAPDVKAIYIVDWQGRPVATASSRCLPDRFPGAGIVHWVGTQPHHAHRGLSSVLITRLFEDFLQRGYTEAVLETDDFRIPAIRLYLKFGFTPVYEVDGEDHRCRWSAIFQTLFSSNRP